MLKRKLAIVGFALAILVVAIVIFILEIGSLRQVPATVPSGETPEVLITPGKNIDVVLVSVDPPADPGGTKSYGPTRHVLFTFNKEIDPARFQVEISPLLPLLNQFGKTPREVFVSPQPPDFWQPGKVYTITIKKGTQAIDGSTLKKDIVYRIQAKLQGGD